MRLCFAAFTLLSACLLPCAAQERPSRFWRVSVALLSAATAADVHSSWGKHELNPLLRNGGNRFGAQGLAVKAGVTGGAVLAQALLFRRKPASLRGAAVGNIIVAGALTGIAIRNHNLPPPRPAAPLR
mgnify:CR=1 FL=1